MTLFKGHEYWATDALFDPSIELDNISLCVSPLLEDGNKDFLVTGSFTGALRIFLPSGKDFRAEDLVLETELRQAVVQLSVGAFERHKYALYVLHPRHISVFSISQKKESRAGSVALALQEICHHKLERTAMNMVHGHFGKLDANMICVQSMDGALSFFAKTQKAFQRFLPHFVVPGPLCYVAAQDMFVTASSDMYIRGYRFLSISSADTGAAQTGSQDPSHLSVSQSDGSSGKRLQPEWEFNAGETVFDICLASPNAPFVIATGERTVYWLDDGGVCKYSRKFEATPTSVVPYRTVGDRIDTLVATADDNILVMHHNKVVWAFSLPASITAMVTVRVRNIEGLLAVVDETGRLSCLFAGTNPALPVLPRQVHDPPKAVQEELRKLQAAIHRAESGEADQEVTTAAQDGLCILLDQPKQVGPTGTTASHSLTARLVPTTDQPVKNVRVTAVVARPFHAVPADYTAAQLSADVAFTFEIGMSDQRVATSTLECTVTASFEFQGRVHSVSKSALLPPSLAFVKAPPTKAANIKLTLHTDKSTLPLERVFPDLLPGARDVPAVGLVTPNKTLVSVLGARTSGRYRIQADRLQDLAPTVEATISGLVSAMRGDLASGLVPAGSTLRIDFREDYPWEAYSQLLQEHAQAFAELEAARNKLAEAVGEHRAFAKRLLARIQAKVPAPLEELDRVMETSNEEIAKLSRSIELLQQRLSEASAALSSANLLIVTLARLHHGLDEEQSRSLHKAFPWTVVDTEDQPWEQVTLACLRAALPTAVLGGQAVIDYHPLSTDETSDLHDGSRTSVLRVYLQALVEKLEPARLRE